MLGIVLSASQASMWRKSNFMAQFPSGSSKMVAYLAMCVCIRIYTMLYLYMNTLNQSIDQ